MICNKYIVTKMFNNETICDNRYIITLNFLVIVGNFLESPKERKHQKKVFEEYLIISLSFYEHFSCKFGNKTLFLQTKRQYCYQYSM